MIKDMKFHIYNFSHDPLCWELSEDDNDRAIEFDNEEEAKQFLKIIKLYYPDIYEEIFGIVEDILYYDGGYIHGALALELMKKELKEERGLNF